MRRAIVFMFSACAIFVNVAVAHEPSETIPLWPYRSPGMHHAGEAERDMTVDEDRVVAGRRVMRLGNVSTPLLVAFLPPEPRRSDLAIIVCPGGGHRILAWDLEGTEVAEWLNGLGISAFVLKYRVPADNPRKKYEAAVQDAHQAIRLIRNRAPEWGISSEKIGVLGFSAGGQVAVMTCVLQEEKPFVPIPELPAVSARPNFAVLIYPAGLVTDDGARLLDELIVNERTPPMFFAHAFDDEVPVANSLLMALALQKVGVSAEVHIWATGGHGFGLRTTHEPCTRWPEACEAWLRRSGRLSRN